jgi:hypothetical protein
MLSSDSQEQLVHKLARFNDGRVNMMLLHPELTEGISTRGVRQVHLMEPIAASSKQAQVIGRAVRYGSHAHLPAPERVTDVYEYVATGSSNVGGKYGAAFSINFNWPKVKAALRRFYEGHQREYFPGTAPTKRTYDDWKTRMQRGTFLSPDEIVKARQSNMSRNVKDILDVFARVSPKDHA